MARETLDHTIWADIECHTGLGQLQLFEEATEDSYQAWSTVAGSIINSSEVDTLDCQNLEEQMIDDLASPFPLAESNCSKSHQFYYKYTTYLEVLVGEQINEIKSVSHDPFIVLTQL